ncbi:MAG: EAL domain-containing protein [Betaproteobacteria bacterium]|nr:EAL domain-containing protein [Betaproteobacteria bacterium]
MPRNRHDSKLLSRALSDNELVLRYQPKVDMRNGQAIGADALICWPHPERGLLMPAEFLHLARGTELEAALDGWAIAGALAQMESWANEGILLPVGVNISARYLERPDFAPRLSDLLQHYPAVSGGDLELEILESGTGGNIAGIAGAIGACRALGVRFSLAGFRRQHASLHDFSSLPADMLKIGRSVVGDMFDTPENLFIVEAIVGLGKTLKRQIVAEGVDSIEHGALLIHMGCHLGRGDAIARPMPAGQVPLWLQQWQGYASWKMIASLPVAREDVALVVAEDSFRHWFNRVGAYLDASAHSPDNERHRVGRQKLNLGQERYGTLHRFLSTHPTLTLHERFQESAEQMIALIAAGKTDEARARLPELLRLSDTLLPQIRQVLAQRWWMNTDFTR